MVEVGQQQLQSEKHSRSASRETQAATTGAKNVPRFRRQWATRVVKDGMVPSLKAMAPLIFAAFLCSVFTVTHPIARWTGTQVYLILPYLYLFLNPAGATVGQHVENVVFILIGCFMTLAVSFLALCGTVWIDGSNPSAALTSTQSKAIAACTLVGLFFVGGLIGSVLPRFNNAVRAGLFSATFALTRGASQIQWSVVSDFWYPLCLAAGASLVANLLVTPITANSHFASLLVKCLDDTGDVVRQTVKEFFDGHDGHLARTSSHGTTMRYPISDDLLRLRKSMLDSTAHLAKALEQAAHEVSFSRIPASRYTTTLGPLQKVSTWISCGLGLGSEHGSAPHIHRTSTDHVDERKTTDSAAHLDFRPCLEDFAQEITKSFDAVATTVKLTIAPDLARRRTHVALVSGIISMSHGGAEHFPKTLTSQRTQLHYAVNHFRRDLDSLLSMPHLASSEATGVTASDAGQHGVRRRRPPNLSQSGNSPAKPPAAAPAGDTQDRTNAERVQPTLFKSSIYEMSFLMVSLLEIAKEADAALAAAQEHLAFWLAHPRRKIWWPMVPWKHWLRKTGGGLISHSAALTEVSYNHHVLHLDDDGHGERDGQDGSSVSDAIAREDEYCRRIFADDDDQEKRVDMTQNGWGTDGDSDVSSDVTQAWRRLTHRVRVWSHRRSVLRVRFAASRIVKMLKTSRHLRFAFKLTLGASLLSLPAWLESSRSWFIEERGAWAIISYFWVLEKSSGATVLTAMRRVAGTVMGCVLGLIAVEIGQGNAYALVVLLTVLSIPSAYLMTLSSMPVVGVVSGTALSLVVGISYTQYIVPSPSTPISSGPLIAAIRGYEVGAGIVAALIINLFLWPYHARVECVANIAKATTEMQRLYTSLARQMLQRGFITTPETSARFAKMETTLGKRLRFSRSLLVVMDGEVSLVLRPVALLDGIITRLEKVSDLLAALRHVREKGLRYLRSEIVFSVLGPRQDLVSCVSLTLWTIGQSLRTHSPLPQFLPSPRLALRDLTLALRAQIEAVPAGGGHEHVSAPSSPAKQVLPTAPAAAWVAPDAYHALMRVGEPHWRQSTRSSRSIPASRRGSPHRSGSSTPRSAAFGPATLHSMERRALAQASASERRGSHHYVDHQSRPANSRQNSEPIGLPLPREGGSSLKKDCPANSCRAPVPNRTYLWMFAEHSILSAMIGELESLLDETRTLCGEVTFIQTEYLPFELQTLQVEGDGEIVDQGHARTVSHLPRAR